MGGKPSKGTKKDRRLKGNRSPQMPQMSTQCKKGK